MIITITGELGAGKSTVASRLVSEFGYEHYDMGKVQRDMARERGVTLEEWQRINEQNASIDKEIEAHQKKLGETKDDFVIEGRLSHMMIPHAVKVFLYVDPRVAAKRVFKAKRGEAHNEKTYSSEQEVYDAMVARAESEKKRWREYYNLDNPNKKERFDLWLDTTNLSIEEVVEQVLSFVQSRLKK